MELADFEWFKVEEAKEIDLKDFLWFEVERLQLCKSCYWAKDFDWLCY